MIKLGDFVKLFKEDYYFELFVDGELSISADIGYAKEIFQACLDERANLVLKEGSVEVEHSLHHTGCINDYVIVRL